MDKKRFIDLHSCIQGEGRLAGVPHILVRTTGCNLKCVFKNSICDTPYSSHNPEEAKFDFYALLKVIQENPQIKHLMLTGGEPTIHPETVARIVEACRMQSLQLTIETNATVFLDVRNALISMSPKLASSGNKNAVNIGVIQKYFMHNQAQLKFVITSKDDIEEIKKIQAEVGCRNSDIYLMPEGVTKRQLSAKREMVEWLAIENGYNYTDRLHILIHGEKREA